MEKCPLRRCCEFAPELSSGLALSGDFETIDPGSLGKLEHHERGELPHLIAFSSVFVQ